MAEAGAADGGSKGEKCQVSPDSAAAGANVGGDKGTGDDAVADGSDASATGADGAKSAKEVVAAETALANDRYKTTEPSATFNAMKPFERFCQAPDVIAPGISGSAPVVVKLGKLIDKALLYGKGSILADDGFSEVISYDAFAPRPAVYNCPATIEGIVWPLTPLRLNTRSYGATGFATKVYYCNIGEDARDGSVKARCYDIEEDCICEHLMWRVVGAKVDEDDPAVKAKAANRLVEYMALKQRGFAKLAKRGASAGASAGKGGGSKKPVEKPDEKPDDGDGDGGGAADDGGDGDDDGDRDEKPNAKPKLKPKKVPKPTPAAIVEPKLTLITVKQMFPSLTSVGKRRSSESVEQHQANLSAACKVFGRKVPSKYSVAANREFLVEKLGYAIEVPSDDDAADEQPPDEKPPPKGGKRGGSEVEENDSRDAPGDEWKKLPSSQFDGFFYWQNTRTGEVKWEPPPVKESAASWTATRVGQADG